MGTYIILLTFMILGFIGAGGFIKDIDKISNKNNSKKNKIPGSYPFCILSVKIQIIQQTIQKGMHKNE